MVAVLSLWQYSGSYHTRGQGLGYQAVVYTPTLVIVTGIGTVAPPGIVMRFLVEEAEAIDEAALEEIVQPLAFHRKKARYIGIAYRIVNVDRLVTDVVIPTDDKVGVGLLKLVAVSYTHLTLPTRG